MWKTLILLRFLALGVSQLDFKINSMIHLLAKSRMDSAAVKVE